MTNEEIKKEIRLMQNEYLKKWRARNPEKVKKHNADYWRKKAIKKIQEGEQQ